MIYRLIKKGSNPAIALFLASSILISSCNNNAGGSPAGSGGLGLHKQKLKNDSRSVIRLGNGIDTRTNFSTNRSCFVNQDDPNNIIMSDPVGTINFDSSMATEDISKKLGFELSGKADFIWASGELSAKYLKDSSTTRQSLHFNYMQTMAGAASYKVPAGDGLDLLDPSAKKYMQNGDLLSFFNKCGDGFIQTADVGGVLLTDLSFTFSTHEEEEQFAARIGAKVGIYKAMAAFEAYVAETKSTATVNFSALQLGGDVRRLAEIFGTKDYQNNYNITYCSAGDLGHCKQVINDVVNYAQKVFATTVNFKDPSSLYTFNHNDLLYSKLNIRAKLKPLPDNEQAAKDYIISTIKHDKAMKDYLVAYSKQPIFNVFSQDQHLLATFRMAVKEYDDVINDSLDYGIIDACYGDPNDIETECLDAAAFVKAKHAKYKEDFALAEHLANTVLVQPDDAYYHAMTLIPYNNSSACDKNNGKTEC